MFAIALVFVMFDSYGFEFGYLFPVVWVYLFSFFLMFDSVATWCLCCFIILCCQSFSYNFILNLLL